MSRVLDLPRRLSVAGVMLLSVLLSACVTYPTAYYEQSYAYDDRYGDRYAGDYYYGEYDYGDGYYGWPGGYYSSVLWPTYFHYYDPWYRYGYYYGVTWFPRNWYAFSFGHHGYPWWGYHHYSPYRHSWADNHWYGGTGWRHGYRDRYSEPRFGSARNEAERLSQLAGAERRARAVQGEEDTNPRYTGYPVGSRDAAQPGPWSRARDDGMRGGADRYEATRFDARARGATYGQQGRYERGESGWISGAPGRGARSGFISPSPGAPQVQGQVAPQAYPYQRGYPQPDGRAEAYSRGRNAGHGGFQQAPAPMRIEPSRAPSAPSMSFDRGGGSHRGDSGSSRGDSGGWSRGRDDGGQPD